MFIKLFKFFWKDAFNIRSVSFLLALLIITVVIGLGLPTERDSSTKLFEPVHLSVVDDDKSIISYTLIDQFKHLEVVGMIYVETLDEALIRLDTGETLLVLVIPAGFYEETRLGLDRSSLTVYLNEAMPAEATVFVRMLNNATASVEGIQSAIYAYQDTLGLVLDSPSEIAALVEAASVDLAFKLVGRKSILQVDESSQLDTVYFVISALSCLLAALTSLLILMQIRQTRESGLHERLLIAGARPAVLLLVQLYLYRENRLNFPHWLRLAISLLTISSLFFGRFFALYQRWSGFDKTQHFLFGSLFFLIAIQLFYRMHPEQGQTLTIRPLFVVLYAVCFSAFCSFIWEVLEFAGDQVLGTNMQDWQDTLRSGVTDTMLDMIWGLAGAAAGAFLFLPLLIKLPYKTYESLFAPSHDMQSTAAAKKHFSFRQFKKPGPWVLAGLTIGCLSLYYLFVIQAEPPYFLKAIIRLLLFALIPFIYLRLFNHKTPDAGWRFKQVIKQWVLPHGFIKRQIVVTLLLGGLILLAINLLIQPLVQLFGIASIVDEIRNRTQADRYSIIGALLYIPTINALAEELFFRGILLHLFRLNLSDKPASFASAFLFAIYHLTE